MHLKQRILHKNSFLFLISIVSVFIIILPKMLAFVVPGLDIYIGLMAIPFALTVQEKGRYSTRYYYIAIVLAVLYYLLQVQSLFFLSVAALVCFVIEQTIGKVSRLLFLISIIISPAFNYALSVFSFPIRLKISALVAYVLSFLKSNAVAKGNIIMVDNKPYEVESACLGLGMLTTGYILSFALLAYKQQEKQQKMHFIPFAVWLFISSVLLAFSNIFRIFILVWFDIPPQSAAHDVSGLLALVFYALIPLWFLTPYFIKSKPFTLEPIENIKAVPIGKSLLFVPLAILFVIGLQKFEANQYTGLIAEIDIPKALAGFQKSQPYPDIIQYKNHESVVYYKPCKSYFNSTHTPTICWKGSGLKLIKEEEKLIGESLIMTGILANETDTLYTAWWYQSKNNKTIKQMEWRKDMALNNTPYTLVNVTSEQIEKLDVLLKDNFLVE